MDKVSQTFDKWANIGRSELMEKEFSFLEVLHPSHLIYF